MDRIQGRKSHSDRLDYPESRKKRTSGQFGSVSWPAGRRSDRPEVEQTDSSPEILTSQKHWRCGGARCSRTRNHGNNWIRSRKIILVVPGSFPNISYGLEYVHHAEA